MGVDIRRDSPLASIVGKTHRYCNRHICALGKICMYLEEHREENFVPIEKWEVPYYLNPKSKTQNLLLGTS